MCITIGFGYCISPQIFIALGIFFLAGVAWNFFKKAPQHFFNGKVTVQLKSNYPELSETVTIIFREQGRYQISFAHPHYRNAVTGVGLNQTRLVKTVPDQLQITEKWFPKPLTIVIEHAQKSESHNFG